MRSQRITTMLRGLGIDRPNVAVEYHKAIDRPASGKLQLVLADPKHFVMA